MTGPKRIAITLEQCWHEVPGGTATSALGSIGALLAHTDLELIGVSARHREPPPEPYVPPIPVEQLPLPRIPLYQIWHRFRWPVVQRATGPVDVIHVTGMAMPPKSAPMVVTVHDLAFLHEPKHFTAHGVRFFNRAIELARRHADVVICPSMATIDECISFGFDRERVRLVPWGIDVEPASPEAIERVRASYQLSRPYILWTGTIEPRKNLPTLLDAFGKLGHDDIDLVLAGPEGWNDELTALEARAGANVRRIGFVPSADLPALYAGADMFCFPSRREGFGLPVLEAMAQATPVITSSHTATAEVVGEPNGSAGLVVPPDEAGTLADAMNQLLEDPRRARTMGLAGRERARTFSWARTAELLEAAYRDAAG